MHKFHTRFLSLLLALVMSFSMMTAAFAADSHNIPEDAKYITDENTGTIIYITDHDGNVIYYRNPETGKEVWYDHKNDSADNAKPTNEDPAAVTSFSDVKTTAWYYNDVTECAKLGTVAGFEDGAFRPDDKVSSVQLITMLTRTFYNDKVEEAKKSKPAGTPWYWANLKVADDVGMSEGLEAIDDNAMNRYEMSCALINVANDHKKLATADQYDAARNAIKDYGNIPFLYRINVQYCYALGILTGMADGEFHGEESMTRAQACTVIMRMLKLINSDNPGDTDNGQYDDGKDQNTGNNNNNNNQNPPAQTTTGKLANGQDATVENVQAILDQIKREYPEGTVWSTDELIDDAHNNYYAAGTHTGDSTNDVGAGIKYGTGSVSLKYGCGGWAAMVSDRIFGQTGAPCREVTDPSKARPGDILVSMYENKIWHIGIILKYVPVNTWYVNEKGFGSKDLMYDNFITCDGNLGARSGEVGTVTWGLPNSLYESKNYHVLTRYPD